MAHAYFVRCKVIGCNEEYLSTNRDTECSLCGISYSDVVAADSHWKNEILSYLQGKDRDKNQDTRYNNVNRISWERDEEPNWDDSGRKD